MSLILEQPIGVTRPDFVLPRGGGCLDDLDLEDDLEDYLLDDCRRTLLKTP